MGFEAIYNWGVHHLVHDVASHPHTPTPPQVAPLVAYQEAGVWWKKTYQEALKTGLFSWVFKINDGS